MQEYELTKEQIITLNKAIGLICMLSSDLDEEHSIICSTDDYEDEQISYEDLDKTYEVLSSLANCDILKY